MTSEQAVTSPVVSPLAAIALKVAGAIAILSALIDFLIPLILPAIPENGTVQWLLATLTQFVDRGIIPLVGMALLFAGLWLESSLGQPRIVKQPVVTLRFWVYLLAAVLGLVYLLLPLPYARTVYQSSQQALQQVSTEAGQAAAQMQQQLSNLSQQQAQIGALLQNEEALSQVIQSGQLPADIGKYRDDPEGLTQYLQQQADQAKQQVEAEISTRRTQAERRVKTEAWRAGIRVSLISLLLSAGYATIGWIGLRRLLSTGSVD